MTVVLTLLRTNKIDALEDAGVNDYLTKLFGFGELLARIRVALCHLIQIGAITPIPKYLPSTINNRVVTRVGEDIHLSPIQYHLLNMLIKHSGKVPNQ